jgi:hypothetical protein
VNLVKAAEIYLQKSFVQVSESEEFLAIGFKEVNEIIGAPHHSYLFRSSAFFFFQLQIPKIVGGKLRSKEIAQYQSFLAVLWIRIYMDPH